MEAEVKIKHDQKWSSIRDIAYEQWEETGGLSKFEPWYVNWLEDNYAPPTEINLHYELLEALKLMVRASIDEGMETRFPKTIKLAQERIQKAEQ